MMISTNVKTAAKVLTEASPVQVILQKAKLYCITMPQDSFGDYEAVVRAACRGGADAVQLRDKNLSGKDLLVLARGLKEVCREHGVIFILNDHLDVALASGADGVHLGQDDLPLSEARKIVDRYFDGHADRFLIGCSTHSIDQARKAQREGADYLGCGPVFATPTKPAYGAVGLELVRQYRAEIRIPFVAIGGIDETNIGKVFEAGARCAAVVRAAFGKKDSVESSVRSLKGRLGGNN